MKWFVYILCCSDGSLYTGITTDTQRRLNEHNSKTEKAAKSLRGRQPVRLVYMEKHTSRSSASVREYYVKHLTHNQKLSLISGSTVE